MAINNVGDSQTFSYTGTIQTFAITKSGLYKLEVKGAKGGNTTGTTGGSGGYACGYKKLKRGQTLYIVCGGTGTNVSLGNAIETYTGGYNGGGSGGRAYDHFNDPIQGTITRQGASGTGGGATHIATRTGLLNTLSSHTSDILIVGGGGGGGSHKYNASAGATYGKTNGGNGGNQSASYSFGQGQNGATTELYDNGAGGGGYMGGVVGSTSVSSSGGSSNVDNVPSITLKGVTYSPSMSAGTNAGQGSAILTLVAKTGIALLGTKECEVYKGNIELDSIYLGNKEIG